MDIKTLPDIEFCETDAAAVESRVITVYEAVASVSLAKGDPVRLFLEGLAAIIAQQNQVINQAGKNNLLRYATGDYLEHKGAMTATDRLAAKAAITTERFSLDAALAFAVTIPLGTRVTPDGQLMFSTTAAAEISIGQTYIDVSVTCETAGEIGNGYVVGQINRLVDVDDNPYITAVSNTTQSSGGADDEDDDRYRERIQLSPERLSVAGPDGAYEFWAKTAHQDIIDVAVSSPAPVQVVIRPLLKGGVLPDQDLLDLVAAAVTSKKVRPLTDQVTVSSPSAVSYDLVATYYISSADSTLAAQIQVQVEAAKSAYLEWQRSKIGRDINPDELVKLVKAAGAKRLAVTSPAYTLLDRDAGELAQEGTVTFTYGGLEDE